MKLLVTAIFLAILFCTGGVTATAEVFARTSICQNPYARIRFGVETGAGMRALAAIRGE